MPGDSKSRKSVLFNVIAVCVIVVAAFAVKPLRIMYHYRGMNVAWSSTFQKGATNSENIIAFERHRDALVSYGYFSRNVIDLQRVKSGSPEHRALYEALSTQAKNGNGYFAMQGFEPAAKPLVIVWALPSKMGEWTDLIAKHETQAK